MSLSFVATGAYLRGGLITHYNSRMGASLGARGILRDLTIILSNFSCEELQRFSVSFYFYCILLHVILIAALEEQQENFCKLPSEVENFVGREKPLEELVKALEINSDDKFVMITGGPCFGKSSLAVQIGYEMYERGYNYVAWINMRDITRNVISPTLGDIAENILQQFNIDTSDMKDDIEACLTRKLKMISDNKKTALLIFDNADNLVHPAQDESCQSTAFERLCKLIRDSSKNSIRAIFTSRVCNIRPEVGYRQMKLEYLSDADSRTFFNTESYNKSLANKDALIEDLVAVCHGLPYALQLISSEVASMDSEEMIGDYVNDLKKSPIDELDDNSRLMNLFDLSYNRLKQDEQDAFTSLAVFPSGFSYSYLSKFGRNLDGKHVKPKILQTLERHSLVSYYDGRYLIHPFLRDFLQFRHWDSGSRVKYETAYYKTYIKQLFALARESLEKDKYRQCLSEFQQEQQNFVYVMAAIGREWENCPPYLRTTLKDLLIRPTPDYICVLLFYCHELYVVDAIDFFKGCETFVEGQTKKNIWCCRCEFNLAICEKEIDDIYNDIEPDEYGKALVEKRKWTIPQNKDDLRKQFKTVIASLDSYIMWAENLGDNKMKDYFMHKFREVKVRLSKRVYKCKELKINGHSLIRYLEEALDICEKSFGQHGLTVDCHTQLAKFYWFLDDTNNAKLWFDTALQLAESVAYTGSTRYLICLLDKGRLLVESKDKESKEEGRKLLEDGIERCKDVLGEILKLLGLQSLITVDRTKIDVIIKHVLEDTRLLHRTLNAMHSAVLVAIDYPDDDVNVDNFIAHEKSTVEKLRQAINHVEKIFQQSIEDEGNLFKDRITRIYVWNMMLTRKCMHVLTQDDTKECASKALTMLNTWPFIGQEQREELSLILKSDKYKYELMQKKCYFDQMAKRIPSMKNQLEEDYANLLKSCEKYQDVWSWAVRGLTRDDERYYEKVTPYLLTQSKPDANLLKLVLHKFLYQMDVYKRESRRDVIGRRKRAAVNEIKSAIKYVESLLDRNHTNGSEDSSPCLEDALKAWYTNLAIKSNGILPEEDRRNFASRALEMSKDNDNIVTDRQKNILERLVY